MQQQLSILVCGDHDLFREALARALRDEPDFAISTAESKATCLNGAREGRVDMVLLDLNMPDMNNFEGLTEVISALPESRVVVLSASTGPEVAKHSIERGAAGFIPKTLPLKALPSAIRLMATGEVYVPVSMLDGETTHKSRLKLTDREVAVARYLFEGRSNKEIAIELGLSEVTVKMVVKSVSMKLGAKNRTQAAIQAQREGFI